ncbi:MAG: DeoR/GlpR family DNA-binding transcription regulator [bacterium]
MLKEERKEAILKDVELHNRVLLADLAESLDVSIDTARRDVKELDTDGKLRKVHGGAVSLGFNSLVARNTDVFALEEKMTIAEKALDMVREGSVIFIDGGTTCIEFARMLPADISITCFTFSIPVAHVLMTKPNIETIFIGGKIDPEAQITIGLETARQFGELEVDFSFIGTGYVDPVRGLTEFSWDVVQMKKAVIAASKKSVLLCISQKLNSHHRYKTCDLSAIHTMITELDPSHNRLNLFRDQELQLR